MKRALVTVVALIALAVPSAAAKKPGSAEPAGPPAPVHPPAAAPSPATEATPQQLDTQASTSPPATCDYLPARTVFAQWHDNRGYVLTENGGLEQGSGGWTLSGGAAVAEGNETFFLNDASDRQSLSLPPGSSATSPSTCVAANQPVFRFVARRDGGGKKSRLEVEVLYLSATGKHRSLAVGKLRGGEQWGPSKKLAVRLGRAKGSGALTTAAIAVRFTPRGAGTWQVDDLLLDPRLRH